MTSNPTFGRRLLSALIAGLVTLLVTGPLLGIKLDGYEFTTRLSLPLLLGLIVSIFTLLGSLLPLHKLRRGHEDMQPMPAKLKAWQFGL
ncbi:MAG: hypothetical protein ACOVS5_06175, partial [Oligoflexus sp.]